MLNLSITTPERRVAGPIKVKSVTIPGGIGEMTVLPGHRRLITTLGIGVLKFEGEDGKVEVAAVANGFAEILDDHVTILAERLELAKEIDLERARKAQQRAEEKLKAKETFEEDLAKYTKKLSRSRVRQEVAQFLLPPH